MRKAGIVAGGSSVIDTIAIPIISSRTSTGGCERAGALKQDMITVCEHSLQTIYSHSRKYHVEVL